MSGFSNRRRGRRTVTRVIDGDTFQVARRIAGTRTIRIANVNAPERGQRGFTSATSRLASQIRGRHVSLNVVARDRYGRAVSNVRVNRRKLRV